MLPLFKEHLKPQFRINKMLNEHNVNYHHSLSRLTFRLHSLIPHNGFMVHFLPNLYNPPWWVSATGIMHFNYCFNYWKMHLRVKNLNQDIFNHTPPGKAPLGSYNHSPGGGKLLIPPGSVFSKIYPPAEKGRLCNYYLMEDWFYMKVGLLINFV